MSLEPCGWRLLFLGSCRQFDFRHHSLRSESVCVICSKLPFTGNCNFSLFQSAESSPRAPGNAHNGSSFPFPLVLPGGWTQGHWSKSEKLETKLLILSLFLAGSPIYSERTRTHFFPSVHYKDLFHLWLHKRKQNLVFGGFVKYRGPGTSWDDHNSTFY